MTQTEKLQPTAEELALNKKFRAKWDELLDWGFKEGIYIDAFVDYNQSGIRPYISYRPLTEVEKVDYKDFTEKQLKTKLQIAKNPKIIV